MYNGRFRFASGSSASASASSSMSLQEGEYSMPVSNFENSCKELIEKCSLIIKHKAAEVAAESDEVEMQASREDMVQTLSKLVTEIESLIIKGEALQASTDKKTKTLELKLESYRFDTRHQINDWTKSVALPLQEAKEQMSIMGRCLTDLTASKAKLALLTQQIEEYSVSFNPTNSKN